MAVQITKQPKCNPKRIEKHNTPSLCKRFYIAMVQAIKSSLSYMLVRPATYRFLLVHLPEMADKLKKIWDDACDLF